MAGARATREALVAGVPHGEEGLRGAIALGDQQADGAIESIEARVHFLCQRSRRSRGAKCAADAAGELAERNLAGRQPQQLLRVAELLGIARAYGSGRQGPVVLLDGPWVGEYQRVAAGARVQHQRARGVAIAEADHAREPRLLGPEG